MIRELAEKYIGAAEVGVWTGGSVVLLGASCFADTVGHANIALGGGVFCAASAGSLLLKRYRKPEERR